MILDLKNKLSSIKDTSAQTKIKVLLLENISPVAVGIFEVENYQIEYHSKALSEEDLIEKIKDVQVVGIRSKTKLSSKVLSHAKELMVVGCFCIGTNQVDLDYASQKGIAVFNSPFSNSRSVAEMVLATIIFLSRQMGDRNIEVHQGIWNKVSKNCYEVRGKTLGIIGYGHIGSQLSVLAESLGLNVLFFDILQIMPLGSAKQVPTLKDLLNKSDYVTLHVPETIDTKLMIGEEEISNIKKGGYLINASRGSVVDIDALAKALKSNHLSGASIDVYPSEPSKNGEPFTTPLQGCPNTILTPHIGGSTEEAQSMIGHEVGTSIVNYLQFGTTLAAVNLPQIQLRSTNLVDGSIRVAVYHHNVPGVLKSINNILSDYNVERQTSESLGDIAYLVADINPPPSHQSDLYNHLQPLHQLILQVDHNIRTYVIA